MVTIRRAARDTDNFSGVIIGRGNLGLFLRIPPFVGHDAMAVGIGSGEEGGMPRRGAGVGIVVVAVSEISAPLQQKTEPAFAPLIAVTLQVIAPKLVDHYDDHQLGPPVVGGAEARAREGKT